MPSPTSRTGDLPRLISVETTNHCNARCVFCPNNALARGKGPMAQDLFEKIIDDCTAFPLEAIEPFLQGEPFSDPQILPRLELIRRRLPRTKLRLYTNGYAMTKERIDALASLQLDHLYVSLNTVDPIEYRELMGLKFERTQGHLEYLTDPVRRGKIANKITFRMIRMPYTTLEAQERFMEYCREKQVRCMIVGLFNYKGDVHSALPVPRYGCEHVNRLDLLADGRTTLCCMDQDGEYGWGSAAELSVLELYQHPTARRFREYHAAGRRRECEPCDRCNLFWPQTRGLGPFEAVRMAAEYLTYLVRYRPIGKRPPTAPPPHRHLPTVGSPDHPGSASRPNPSEARRAQVTPQQPVDPGPLAPE